MHAFNHLKYAACSDIGRKRTNNEDSFGVFPESGIFCVSDGMGGGDDGEVASAATVKGIEDLCKKYPLPDGQTYLVDDMVAAICCAVNGASDWIWRRAQEKKLKGCGATFVGVCFDAANPTEAVAVHAGDSRLYRIRGRSILQITKDHSAAELIGAKNDKDVNPMFRGMILRAVGVQPSVEVERTPLPIKGGDRILICSDGLSRMVPDRKISSIVRSSENPDAAVHALIAAANEAGGIDNVTAVLVEVGPLPKAMVAVAMPEEATGDGRFSRMETKASRGLCDADSGAGFITAATGLTGLSDDGVTATNTVATFSEAESGTDSDSGTGENATAATQSTDPTSERPPCPVVECRKNRQNNNRLYVAIGVLLLVVAVLAGGVFLYKRHVAEVQRAEEARKADEAAAAQRAESMRAEQERTAAEARMKAEQERLAREKSKAEEEARIARQKTEAARAALKKAEEDRLRAREKVAAEAAAAQKARREAEAAIIATREAKRKAAEAKAAIEQAKQKEAGKASAGEVK